MSDQPYDMPSTPVHLASAAPGVLPAAAAPRPREMRLVPVTITLSSQAPERLLLPKASSREYAIVQALDSPVVVCDSQGQAQAPVNNDATLAAPEGSVIPVGVVVPLLGTNELWVTAPTLPARVSVIAAYCE